MSMLATNDASQEELLLSTFSLGGSWYGLEASQVQEVILVEDNTVVYHAPEYVRGIINLRGKIVTVLDLEIKLGLPVHQVSEDSRIIVVEWNQEQVGLLVEAVSEVITPGRDQVEAVPLNINQELSRYMLGVCKDGERLIGILDLDKVLEI